jgi:hypothetical protein
MTSDVIRGDWRPSSDGCIEGVITDSLYVVAGVSIELRGRVQRDAIVYSDGRLTIADGAVVVGDLHNFGGWVEVIGSVQGRIHGAGQTIHRRPP